LGDRGAHLSGAEYDDAHENRDSSSLSHRTTSRLAGTHRAVRGVTRKNRGRQAVARGRRHAFKALNAKDNHWIAGCGRSNVHGTDQTRVATVTPTPRTRIYYAGALAAGCEVILPAPQARL